MEGEGKGGLRGEQASSLEGRKFQQMVLFLLWKT